MIKNIKSEFLFLIAALCYLNICISCNSRVNTKESWLIINLFSNERTALPSFSLDFEKYDWLFEMFNVDEETSLNFKINGEDNVFPTISLPVEKGNWKVMVYGYDKVTGKEMFIGRTDNLLIDDGGFYEIDIQVLLIKERGFGDIFLKIDTRDSLINKVCIYDTATILDDIYSADENNLIIIDKKSVPAGNYSAVMKFYFDDIFVFSWNEVFNIRNNCITETWDESIADFILENEMLLTNKVVNQICGNVFYVQEKDGLQKLIDTINRIKILNDEKSEYRIYADGVFSDTNEVLLSNYDILSVLNITSDKLLKLEICGNKDGSSIINANGSLNKKKRVLTVGENVQLVLRDITICNGYTDQNGGGIYIDCYKPQENEYNLQLLGKSTVRNNESLSSGGGIYIQEGSVLLSGKTVCICENKALQKGGGICIFGTSNKEARTLEIESSLIEENYSFSDSKKDGVGGGLYTQFATVNLNNCIIRNNQAANGGGIGIAQNSNLYLINVNVLDNTAAYKNGKGGGGIFASGVSSKLHLMKGTQIFGNNSYSETYKGGGIYFSSTEVILYDKVTIYGNYYDSDKSSNLTFKSGKTVTVGETLQDSIIGVEAVEFEEPVGFTKNYGRFHSNEGDECFISDSKDFEIVSNEKNELILIKTE